MQDAGLWQSLSNSRPSLERSSLRRVKEGSVIQAHLWELTAWWTGEGKDAMGLVRLTGGQLSNGWGCLGLPDPYSWCHHPGLQGKVTSALDSLSLPGALKYNHCLSV